MFILRDAIEQFDLFGRFATIHIPGIFGLSPYISSLVLLLGIIYISFFYLFLIIPFFSDNRLVYIARGENLSLQQKIYSLRRFAFLRFIKVFLNFIKENLHPDHYVYIPFILFLTFSIGLCNIVGMIPFSLTVSAQFAFTFILSLLAVSNVIVHGFVKYKLKFFSHLIPKGTPGPLVPFIILIELLSYLSRIFSLAIRLFANMTAGHVLLKIICGISLQALLQGLPTLFLFPLISFIIVLICLLEIGVALLQTYVFIVLFCIYLSELTDH